MSKWLLNKIEYLILNRNYKEALQELSRVSVSFSLPSQRRCWAALIASLKTLEATETEYVREVALNSIEKLKLII